MILKNFYNDDLAQASYLIGCAESGEAVVIDPLRTISPYLEVAAQQGLKIVAVTETHIHADYASGSRELAFATGATLYISDEGDADWKYAFANEPGVVLLKNHDVIKIGNLTFEALHTPGHTPEHLAFLLTDHSTSPTPHSLFTGDFIFIGDVGRPDLLERAAQIEGTMRAGAERLFDSLQKISNLPDTLLIWPGHGAGSACGKSLGGSPVSALGYERKSNWALMAQQKENFVNEVLNGQPDPPKYFKNMKFLNKAGAPVIGQVGSVPRVSSPSSQLVDVRQADAIRQKLAKGALAIPDNKSFVAWAGWLLNYDDPITLISESQGHADAIRQKLALIGLDNVTGWMSASDYNALTAEPINVITATSLNAGDCVVDVRNASERSMDHIEGSIHVPLGRLCDNLELLPKDRRIVVHCAGGSRTPAAYSVLKRAGFETIAELEGGLAAYRAAKPVATK